MSKIKQDKNTKKTTLKQNVGNFYILNSVSMSLYPQWPYKALWNLM